MRAPFARLLQSSNDSGLRFLNFGAGILRPLHPLVLALDVRSVVGADYVIRPGGSVPMVPPFAPRNWTTVDNKAGIMVDISRTPRKGLSDECPSPPEFKIRCNG